MKIIEITETKIDKMAEYAEEMLRYGGKLMQCIDALGEDHYGERGGRYGKRMDDYGSRGGSMNYRDDEEWDDDDMMGERRGGRRRRRDSMGRYR